MLLPCALIKLHSELQLFGKIQNRILKKSFSFSETSFKKFHSNNLIKYNNYNLLYSYNNKFTSHLKASTSYNSNLFKQNICNGYKNFSDWHVYKALRYYNEKFYKKEKLNKWSLNTYVTDCNSTPPKGKVTTCHSSNLEVNPTDSCPPYDEKNSCINAREYEEVLSFKICPIHHPNHESAIRLWKILTFLSLLVIFIRFCIVYPGIKEHRKHPRQEFIAYPYLFKRTTPFPWGDGKHSLFHNPRLNALPDGYEIDDPYAVPTKKESANVAENENVNGSNDKEKGE